MSNLTPFLDHLRDSIQSSDDSSSEDSNAPADCSDLSDASVEDDEVSADEDVQIGEGEAFVSKDGAHVYTTRVPNPAGRRSRRNTGGPAPHVTPESAGQSLSYFVTDDILMSHATTSSRAYPWLRHCTATGSLFSEQ